MKSSILDIQGVPFEVPENPHTTLEKGWKTIPNEKPNRAPKTFMYDPMSLMYSLGYKDRQFSLTYDVIRQVTKQLTLTSAIIKHRINQIIQFCSPYSLTKQGSGLGFEIKHKDTDRPMSAAEKRFAKQIEQFILFCGDPRPNKYTGKRRPDFEEFTKKFIRDLMELDQACHPAGTLIELADGTELPIEEIEAGMEVRTHRLGRPRVVTETMNRAYTGKLYTVESGGLHISATDNHPLLVVAHPWFRLSPYRKKGIKPEWVKAKDVKPGNYLVYPKPENVDEEELEFFVFPKDRQRRYANIPYKTIAERVGVHPTTVRAILTGTYTRNGPELKERVKGVAKEMGFKLSHIPYKENVRFDKKFSFLCGAYCAEGNVGPKGSAVNFSLAEDDELLLDGIVECLDELGLNYNIIPEGDKRAVRLITHSKSLGEFLISNFGQGSCNKFLPSWIHTVPEESRKSFVIAYLLGDGNFGPQVGFSTVSKNLFCGLRILLSGLGVYARKSTEAARDWIHAEYVRHNSERYCASLSGENSDFYLRCS